MWISTFLLSPVLWPLSLAYSTEPTVGANTTEQIQRMWDPENGNILGQGGMPIGGLEDVVVTNHTVQKGSTTFLHCHIRSGDEKQVSWIRRRDYHILTSGLHTYSRDERFSIIRHEEGDDWALQIKFVQERDEGTYECHVSTLRERYGYVVNLKVMVPEAIISGPSDIHVQSGSTFSLFCIIEGSLTPPQFILWFHNNKMINYDLARGGIVVSQESEDITSSMLTINDATFRDSGVYNCSASNTKASSVNVYVSEGDKTAAIQRLGSGSQRSIPHSTLSSLTVLLALQVLVALYARFIYGTDTANILHDTSSTNCIRGSNTANIILGTNSAIFISSTS